MPPRQTWYEHIAMQLTPSSSMLQWCYVPDGVRYVIVLPCTRSTCTSTAIIVNEPSLYLASMTTVHCP
jgi:hypothetical protein